MRDRELHALALAWRERGAGAGTPPERLREQVEAAVCRQYLDAGLAAPQLLWHDGPQAFGDRAASPRGVRGRSGALPPWIPALLTAAAGLVLTAALIVVAALLAGVAAGLVVGVAVLAYRGLLLGLGAVGVDVPADSGSGTVLLLATVAGVGVGCVLVLRKAGGLLGLLARGLRRLRPPRWFDDVSAQLPGPPSALWLTLRGVVIALAPPAELCAEEQDGHPVLEVSWPDGAHAVFVDGERVPRRPEPGTAGRQAELFARQWASRHLGPADRDAVCRDAEQALRDGHRLLDLPSPVLRWCDTPERYRESLASRSERPAQWWWGRRRGSAVVPDALGARLWAAARGDLRPGDDDRAVARQQIWSVVVDAGVPWHPWAAQRVLPVATVAEWRWARTVRLGDAPQEPDEHRAEDLVGVLERLERVSWTAAAPGEIVLLTPPRSVERGAVATGDPERPTLETQTVTWADGSRWYLCQGVRTPRPVGADGWTVAEIAAVANTEVRRVLIESIGWDTYLDQAGLPLIAEAPDPANPPHRLQLFGFDDSTWGGRRLLVMTNASPGRDGHVRRFAEFVPDTIDDPVEAAAWQYGVPVEVYRSLERRT